MKIASPEFMGQLNRAQQMAVEATEGPVLVLAGAGSGKTRVLTYRFACLIHNRKASPSEILTMTFTNKAAQEMRERIGKLTGAVQNLWIGTFHSLFARILRIEHQSLNYPPGFVIYDADDQERLIKSLVENDLNKSLSPKSIAAVISNAKNRLIDPSSFAATATGFAEKQTAQIYGAYEAALRRNLAFDFDDLITIPIRMFENRPDILEKYQNRFKYILVDEYQDTNHAQYVLLQALAGKHRNLFVVGDDDQSIYRWRGADIRNILEFESAFPEARIFRLEQNYRSTKTILKAANSVVEKNSRRKGKALWTDGKDGDLLEIVEAEDERDESLRIVDCIKSEVYKAKRTFHEFAILFRTNAQSRSIEEGLRRSGMSYVIVGGVRFYERKEIKDILAYLKLIENPADSVSLRRIINHPPRSIGETSLKHLEIWAAENTATLFTAVRESDSIPDLTARVRKSLFGFAEMVQKYIGLKGQITVNELVHTLVDEIGLLRMYKEDNSLESQGRAENVKEFLNAVDEYAEENESPSLTGFLQEVSLVSDIDSWNDKSNAITLMTLHCAKGLEFPVVLIAGMEEGLFPVYRSLDDPEAMEEERRLFYVGLTRAMEKVYLFWAQTRQVYNDNNYRLPSRFLDELDPGAVHVRKRPQGRYSRGIPKPSWQPEQPHPDYEDQSQEQPELTPGTWVQHDLFGKGQIVGIEGHGMKLKIRVHFDGLGEKKFIAQYARFTIL